MRTKLVVVVASLLLVTGAHAQAPDRSGAPQPSSKPAASKPSALTSKEIKIVNHLHADNSVDMEAGRLATILAADSGVREFGAQLFRHRTAADHELTNLATEHGVDLTATTASEVDPLRSLKGATFDRAFVTMMVRDQEQALKFVRANQAKLKTRELKALIAKLVPMLELHLERSKKLQFDQS